VATKIICQQESSNCWSLTVGDQPRKVNFATQGIEAILRGLKFVVKISPSLYAYDG